MNTYTCQGGEVLRAGSTRALFNHVTLTHNQTNHLYHNPQHQRSEGGVIALYYIIQ